MSESIRKSVPFLGFVLTIYFGSIHPLWAAPLVSNISGTLSHGQTLTVTGTGFGPKTQAQPILWADFENGIDPSVLGQRTSWDANDNMTWSAEEPRLNSTHTALGAFLGGPSSWSFRLDRTYWTKIYMYAKRRQNMVAQPNQKFWRLWSASGTGIDFLAAWLNGGGVCYAEGLDANSSNRYQGLPGAINVWHTEEFRWQESGGSGLKLDGTPGSGTTGVWKYERDGVLIQSREDVDNGNANTHVQLRVVDNFITPAPPSGFKVYEDDVYIDDTYARVMLGDKSTLAASTVREIQIPTSWNNSTNPNTINVQFNQGSFQSGQQVYLFVVDQANVPSSGYAVTIGGTPPTNAAPAAPQNLRVK